MLYILRILSFFLIVFVEALPQTQVFEQFSEVAKKALPAVVIIEAKNHLSDLKINKGSGFFVREDGYIMTNSHILENVSSIKVTTHDKQSFTARIIGLDVKTDIAVIQIDGSDFPSLRYANSDELEIGEFVLSIGYSTQFLYSCELGRIQNIGIGNIGLFQTEDFIQTNALTYLGNSGGPLLNSKGEVIGINTATLVNRDGKYLGESLAISSKLALRSFNEIIQSETH